MSKQSFPDDGDAPRAGEYDLWYDGLLEGARAAREAERVARDPEAQARCAADRAIEASLRRSFGAGSGAPTALRPVPASRAIPAPRAKQWTRYAIAAGLLALAATVAALAAREHAARPRVIVKTEKPLVPLHLASAPAHASTHPRATQLSLGEVFLDALGHEFEPRVGCQTKDPWDAELFQQLETAPCSQESGVVVLGEWVDPRVNVANLVMLRRGENPIMLVVPSCGQETEMCVGKDSGLYVHRGMRDGRTIYEVSPVPGSEVLGCVDAQSVVTQEQL